jgi:hypothetical protein
LATKGNLVSKERGETMPVAEEAHSLRDVIQGHRNGIWHKGSCQIFLRRQTMQLGIFFGENPAPKGTPYADVLWEDGLETYSFG